jgi:topoisomerase-4 subunit A
MRLGKGISRLSKRHSKPFMKNSNDEVTLEDYEKLTEKPVRRIYKLDIDDLQDKIKKLEGEIKEVKAI